MDRYLAHSTGQGVIVVPPARGERGGVGAGVDAGVDADAEHVRNRLCRLNVSVFVLTASPVETSSSLSLPSSSAQAPFALPL